MERLGERSRNGPIGPAEAIQPIRDRHIYVILIVCISKSKRGLKNKYHHQYISQIFHHCHGHDRHYDEQDDGEASKARTSSLKRSVSRRSSSSSRLSLLSKKVKNHLNCQT